MRTAKLIARAVWRTVHAMWSAWVDPATNWTRI